MTQTINYLARLARLKEKLASWSIDLLLITDPKDLFYLTGHLVSVGQLLVSFEKALLLVDGRYIEACQQGPIPVQLWAKSNWPSLVKGAFPNAQTLGFDGAATSYQQYVELQSFSHLKAISSPLSSVRAIKEEGELQALRAAASLCARGFEYILGHIKEGITEKQLAQELELYFLKEGDGASFAPIIAFGPNSAYPHYHPQDVPLTANQPILIDMGATLNDYQSDMTRMVFWGKPDSQISAIYEAVKHAQDAAFALLKEGASCHDVDSAARQVINDLGYGSFFNHSLGHGIGLDLHEAPYLRQTAANLSAANLSAANLSASSDLDAAILKTGMAVTVEPGIYLPQKGGIRLEDVAIITADGFENITPIPREAVYL